MEFTIMTRVYWNCYRWPGRTFNFTLFQILRRIARSGYRAVDLCEYPLEFWPLTMKEEDKKKLKSELEALGLRASGITIPTFSPGLELIPVKEDREIIVERIMKAIELIYYLEGKTVMYGICPVEIFGTPRDKTYQWTLEIFRRCAPLAEDRGIDIAVEFVNRAFPSSESINEFLDEVGFDNVGLCLEVGNINARPRDEPLLEHMERCKDRIKLVHIVDPLNEKWLKEIGVNMESVIRKLKELGYDGYLVMEGFAKSIDCSKLDDEVSKTIKYLRELIKRL
ncbi:MAG: hypothetical protein DRZ82_03635 [Thermoprotei archaeon]|nr:MAG: hypothetical protein DRZ82_03635 [Thermoprotei archaeon]